MLDYILKKFDLIFVILIIFQVDNLNLQTGENVKISFN